MVQFRTDQEWRALRRLGAPPVDVPSVLAAWLEQTFRDQEVCAIPCDQHDEGTQQLLRAARIYCERQGKKFHHQFIDEDGETVLQFRMRNPRVYRRRKIGAR